MSVTSEQGSTMTAMRVAERMTAEEFLALPESVDARRLELVDGEIVVHEPRPLHQMVSLELARAIGDWSRGGAGRGREWLPLDVKIDEFNVFAPDVLWYAEGRGPGRDDVPPSPIPDLVVEVRSPSTWRYDIGAKKSGYERSGLPELWLVDTAAAVVLVFRHSVPAAATFDVALEFGRGDTLTSTAMPGFEVALDSLFAPAH